MRRIWAQGIWITAQEAMKPDKQREPKQSTLLKPCLSGIVCSKKRQKTPTNHKIMFQICL